MAPKDAGKGGPKRVLERGKKLKRWIFKACMAGQKTATP